MFLAKSVSSQRSRAAEPVTVVLRLTSWHENSEERHSNSQRSGLIVGKTRSSDTLCSMADDEEHEPEGNWRWGMLSIAVVLAAVTGYQIMQFEEQGTPALFGAALFGTGALLAFLRARRRVEPSRER